MLPHFSGSLPLQTIEVTACPRALQCVREQETLPDSSWRGAWRAVQEVVGRDQNPSFTLAFGPRLCLGMLCRLGQAPAGQPPQHTAQVEMCQSECTCLSLPQRSSVCQFSSLNFVVTLGHIHCRTIGKDRKAPKREH